MVERNKVFSKRLKQLMKEKNISCAQLGERIGRSANTVQRMCFGCSIPGLFLFMDICDVLEVSMDEFWSAGE